MVEHFANGGWQFDVVTADPKMLPQLDVDALGDLPLGVRVFGAKAARTWVSPFDASVGMAARVFRMITARRGRQSDELSSDTQDHNEFTTGNASVSPDQIRWRISDLRILNRSYAAWFLHKSEVAWSIGAFKIANMLAQQVDYDVVVSCGPPHMAHDAGRRMAARANIPFVMDLRDPWSIRRRLPEAHASPLYFRYATKYEKKAVKRSSLIVANTPALRSAMQAIYPNKSVITVMNGYDETDAQQQDRRETFAIRYAGGIYLDRDPRQLLAASGIVVRDLELDPSQFRLEFVGKVNEYCGVPIEVLAKREGLEGFVQTSGPVARAKVREFMAGAAILVSLPQDSKYAIPSKVFEYMQFDAWILALAEDGTPTHELLSDTDADVVKPYDVAKIAATIRKRFLQFQDGERPIRISNQCKELSRQHQAVVLRDAIEELVGGEGDSR